MKLILLSVIFHSLLSLAPHSMDTSSGVAIAKANSKWRNLDSGLEYYSESLSTSWMFNPVLTAVRVNPKNFDIKVLQASLVGKKRVRIARFTSLKPLALINTNFFDEFGKPLGWVIDRGRISNPGHSSGSTLTGVFAATESGFNILHRTDFKSEGAVTALQAGPRLLVDGKRTRTSKNSVSTDRSGVCIDSENRLILYVVKGYFWGVTLSELQNTLKSKDLGCSEALNFDGGSSSQMLIANSANDYEVIEGEDPVPVYLGVFKR